MKRHFFRQIALCFIALTLLLPPVKARASDFTCSLAFGVCRTACARFYIDPDPSQTAIDDCFEECDLDFSWCLWNQAIS